MKFTQIQKSEGQINAVGPDDFMSVAEDISEMNRRVDVLTSLR